VTASPQSPARKLLDLIDGAWAAQAIHVAAELRLPELLAEKPRTSDDLALATGTHPLALRQLLRALATIDVLRQREDGAFETTPLGQRLEAEHPDSVRAWALWSGAHLWPVWGDLAYSVRTGGSARSRRLGTEGFAHLERDPAAGALFQRAAAELTRLDAAGILAAYDFSTVRCVADLGGGSGELLARILAANPALQGVLFDLPHAAEAGRSQLRQAGVANRCRVVSGDFFERAPEGADLHLLKSVIHDWSDEDCLRLLRSVRRALGGTGRLLVIERVVPERLENAAAHRRLAHSDLTMLVALGSRERTESELRGLLVGAGYRIRRVLPTRSSFSILEAETVP